MSEYTLEKARRLETEEGARIPESDRPLFHLSPWIGWMNDPNGFCFYRGRFHLFYQYHPYGLEWGPMHWGHAESTDLLRWTHLPCALAPDTDADARGCFSGSAVPLPDGRLMLVYTGVSRDEASGTNFQAQCVAFGNGTDFVKPPDNPVIGRALLPDGYDPYDFRDPKAWLAQDGTFRMAVANNHRTKQGTVMLFAGEDTLHWRYLRDLDAGCGEYGSMWECPDYFELEGKQVLIVSPQHMECRDGFHPGSGTMALVGSRDGHTEAFRRETVQPIDQGLDFYAPQTVLSPDGRRILIGWMQSWETCRLMPRLHAWYGQMTAPRELFFRSGRLAQRPIREIETLRRGTVCHSRITVQKETVLPGISGRTLDMTVTLCFARSSCRRFEMRFASDGEHCVLLRYDPLFEELTFDRSRTGSVRDIIHTRRVRVPARDGTLTLRLLLDRESAEVFVNGGECVLTSLFFAPPQADRITFCADAPLPASVEFHPLGQGV